LAKNYYKTLGINRNATLDLIRKAFRTKAKLYHPDAVGEDPTKQALFQEIVEAYEILSDPEKRRRFDLLGRADGLQQAPVVFPSSNDFGFIDLITSFLKPKTKPKDFGQPMQGVDMETEITLDLEETIGPTMKLLSIKIPMPCPSCDGNVWLHDKPASPCPDCDGIGTKKNIGPIPFLRACKRCDGSGKIHLTICESCNLTGLKKTEQRLEVNIPAGVENESVVRVEGLGAHGRFNGPRGHLFLKVRIVPSTEMQREDDHAFTTFHIGFTDAIFGAEHTLPAPFDKTLMKISPGTQGGQTFCLRKKGFTNIKTGHTGNLYVTIQIKVPQELDETAQLELLKLKNRINEL
jgi:molecular chaperone DnaJ